MAAGEGAGGGGGGGWGSGQRTTNGVYWIGTDGKVYVAGANGTNAAGAADANTDTYWGNLGYNRIDDPNPGVTVNTGSVPSGPSSPNGGSGGPVLADKTNDIALQNAGLGATDANTAAGIAAIERALGSLVGQYDTESTSNEGNYSTNSNQNQTNLQKNKQSALVNAAQGRRGLFGTLSSLGALNGSGVDLANRAVQTGANEDLSGAADNYSSNQSGLDTSIGAYRIADRQRREQANTAAADAKTKTTGEGARTKQGYYTNLANDYAAMGNSGEAQRYTTLASELFPTIAGANIPSSNLGYTGAAYTPASLASYLSGANSTAVGVSGARPGVVGPAGLPGLFASDARKKLQVA